MIGRENFHTQCQFLQEMHSLAQPCLKNPRDNLDFAESYFMFIASLVKSHTELVNASAINLNFMLAMCKCYIILDSRRFFSYFNCPVVFFRNSSGNIELLRSSLIEIWNNFCTSHTQQGERSYTAFDGFLQISGFYPNSENDSSYW